MMYHSLCRLPAVVLVFALAACGTSEDEAKSEKALEPRPETIKGSLSYVEEITLAPESVVTVRLIDTAAGDAPEGIVAETVFHYPGRPPVPFTLSYDANRIEGGRQYALWAEIKEQKRLMFTLNAPFPVLKAKEQPPVNIVLSHVPGGHLDRMPEKIRANNPELLGHYRYRNKQGEFIDCADGVVHPVAREEAVFSLESEYRDVAPRYGDEVFVRVAGKYVTRPARDGLGKEDYLVALQVEEMVAGADCP